MQRFLFRNAPRAILIGAALLMLCAIASAQPQSSPFDLVITNGHIVDGTGSPWYSGDIGVRDGRIAAIGNLSASARKKTIDAAVTISPTTFA